MIHKKSEKGQAIILIVFAMVGLIGITALTVDGGMAYSDRRHAQNAADSAAFAAALADAKNQDLEVAAQSIATQNGYDDNGTTNDVTISDIETPSGGCPDDTADNRDITVQIVSLTDTFFGPIVGIDTVTNTVIAKTRVCGSHVTPLFDGNAIVSLNPNNNVMGDCGIDTGNSNSKTWNVTGGGIFSNGCLKHENGTLNVPDDKCLTSVGHAVVPGGGNHDCVHQNQSAKVYAYPADIAAMMPPNPCTGAITNGRYAAGGKIPAGGQTTFDNDVFCISDMDSLDAHIVLNNSTLYVTDQSFDIKFSGGGNPGWSGTATTSSSSPYQGYFMVIAMTATQQAAEDCEQNIEYRGNGNSELIGTIFAPSACLDSRGNAANDSTRSQFIFYNVTSNGTADITVDYSEMDNHRNPQEPVISLIQ